MKKTLGNQDYPGLNHRKTPSLQNEDLAPPSKSLGFRFCTYLVLWSFFFQTLWPSVAFAHVDVPLGAAWRDAASGLTFTVQPFKDPTTHRNLVRLQAQINSKEEWAEQDVTPTKAPASRAVPSSSLPAADNPSAEPLKTPLNPSDVARSALEEKLKTVLDRIVDIEALQPIPSASTQIPYNDLSVTEDGIQWGFGGLNFLLDWNWNVLSSGRAEFDMALKVCTLGTVELDNLFVKQVLAKGRDVLFSGNGRIDRMDAWATGIQGASSRPGIVRIAKDSEQRFHQIFIHQGRGENFGNLHIEESLNQNEAFQNNSHMHMDRGASVKGGSVFTNTAILEGESYSVQSALIRNEGTGDQKAVMQATNSLNLVAPKLEQKGLLKSPEVDLLGVQQIEDSVDSLIDVDLLKTQLTQTWTQTGTIDAGEWQDTSAYEVFIQNKGGIKTYNETSISARFRTLQGGKSDLSGVSLLNPLDRDQPLENEGEAIFRHAKDLGGNPRAIQNGAGASLVILDSDSIGILSLFNRGHVVLWDGGYRVGVMDNEGGTLQVERLRPLNAHLAEWILTGDISVQSLHVAQEDSLQKIIQRSRLKCGSLRLKVSDFLGEPGSELIIGVPGLEPKASQFEVKTFLSQGKFQSSVPVKLTAEKSIKIPGPMTLEQPSTFKTPILETSADFITRDSLTLEDCYWTHQRGQADIAELLFGGKDISAYGDVLIRQMDGFALILYSRHNSTIPVLNVGRGHRFHIQKGGAVFGKISNYGVTVLEDGTYRFTKLEGPGTLEADWLIPEGSQDLDFTGDFYGSPGKLHAKHFSTYAFKGSKITTGGSTTFDYADINVDTLANKGAGSQLTISSGTSKVKVLDNEADIVLNGSSKIVTDALHNSRGTIQSPNGNLRVLMLDQGQAPQTSEHNSPTVQVAVKGKIHDIHPVTFKAKDDLIVETAPGLDIAEFLRRYGEDLQCGGLLRLYGDIFRAHNPLTYPGAAVIAIRDLEVYNHLIFRSIAFEAKRALFGKNSFLETRPNAKRPEDDTSLKVESEETLDARKAKMFSHSTLELESTDGDLLVAERGKVIRNIGPYGPSGTFVQGYSKNGSWLASNKDMSLIGKNLRLLYAEITSHGKLFLGAEKLVESVGSNIFAKTSIRIKAEEFSHRIAHSGAVDSGMWCASVPIEQLKTGYMYFPQSDPALLSTLGNLHLNVLNFTIYGSKILVGDSIIRGRQSWQGETGCPFIKADAIKNHQSYHDVMVDYFTQVGGSPEMDWGPQHFLAQVQAGKKIRMSSQNMQDSGYVSGNDLKLSLDRALFEFLGRVVDDIQKEVEKHGTLSISWFIEGSENGFIQEKLDGSLGYAVPMIEDGASSIETSALPVAGQTSLGVSPSVIFRVQRGSSLEKRGILQMMAAGMGRIYTLKDFSFDNVVDHLLRNGQEAYQSGALMDPRAIQYHKACLFFHLQKMHDARTLEEKIKAFLTLYIPPSMRQAPEMGAVRGQDTCDVQIEEYIESIGGEFSAQGEGAKVNMTGPGNGVFKPAVKWQGDMADGGQQIEKRTTFNGQDAVNVELDEIDTYAISGKAGKGGVHLKAKTRHIGHAVPLQSVQTIREGRKTVRTQEVNHAVDEIETTGKTTHSNESGPVILTAPRVKAKDGSAIIGQGIHVAHVQNERLVEISEKSGGGGGLFGGRETERRLQTGAYTAQGAVFESDNPLTMIDTAGVGITLDKITVRCPKTVLISLGGIVQLLQGEELHTSLLSEKCSDPFWQSIRQRAEQHRTYSSSEFSGPIEVHARQLIVEEVCGQALSFKDQIDLKTGEMSIRYLEELHQVVECRAQGPTAALAAVIALAATIAAIASGGAAAAGAMAVQATATTGMTASIISAMGYAGFISVCAQTAVALGNNKMNIGRAAQDLASTQSLKALLLAMAAAGVVAGASQFLGTPATAADATARATDQASQAAVASNPPPIPSMPQVPPPVPTLPQSVQSSLSQHLQFNLVNAGASAALDMVINGTSPGSDLKGKLLNVGVNTLAATAANTIAFSLNEGFIDKFGQFMCHLGVGAGIGAAVSGRDGFADGIIFAGIAEGIASLAKDDPAVLKAKATAKAQDQGLEPTRKNLSTFVKDELRKVVDIGRLGTAVFALFARKDVDLAARIATNALEHNFSKSELEACLDAYTNVALDQVQEDEDFVRDASDAAVDEANKSLEERAEKTPIGKAHKAVKDGVKEGVKAGAKAVGLDRLADAVSDHIDLDGLRDAASSHADRVGQGASGYAASKIEQVEALRGPLNDEQRSFLQQEFEDHHAEDAFARDMMNVAADGVALLFTLPGKAAEAVLNQTNLTSDATAHALGNLTNDAVALVGGAMAVKQAFKAGAAGLGKQTLGKSAPRFHGLAAANANKAPVFMTPSANRNLADAIGHRMQATGTHGPAPSFATRMMAKDDSFLPRSAGGLGRSEGLGTSGVSGARLGRDAPRPTGPKSAVKTQGADPTPKKEVSFGDQGAKMPSNAVKLRTELALKDAGILDAEGKLTPLALEKSKWIELKDGVINNPEIRKTLTRDGSSIGDWNKYYTPTATLPNGQRVQIHYYRNDITGKVDYLTRDFKIPSEIKP